VGKIRRVESKSDMKLRGEHTKHKAKIDAKLDKKYGNDNGCRKQARKE
jgi:hypothetical protein